MNCGCEVSMKKFTDNNIEEVLCGNSANYWLKSMPRREFIRCASIAVAALATGCAAPRSYGESFDGEFFPPVGPSKKTGVLVLGGSDGGIPGRRAKLIAEKGFPTLALGYFKTTHTPDYLDMIPLEYFDQPVEWLRNNKYTHDGRVVVIGESKGAELALLLASRKPEISAVVVFVPVPYVFQGIPKDYRIPRSSWTYKGEQIPFVPYDLSNIPDPNNILSIYRNSLKQVDVLKRATIPVHKIKGPIMLFSAQDDQMWPSYEFSETIIRTLKERSFSYTSEHITYENAGHTMTEYFMMGGTKEGNRAARIDSTARMLSFLESLSSGQ